MPDGIVEDPFVEKWLYGKFFGSAPLRATLVGERIFRSRIIPQDDASILLPCLKFFKVASDDSGTINATRIWNTLVYQVEVCDRGDSNQHMIEAAVLVDRLLHRQGQAIGDIVTIGAFSCEIHSCRRRDTISRDPIDNNERFQFLGGVYEIKASAV